MDLRMVQDHIEYSKQRQYNYVLYIKITKCNKKHEAKLTKQIFRRIQYFPSTSGKNALDNCVWDIPYSG